MPRTLSDYQRRKIQQIIQDGHLAFAVKLLGPTAIAREDYERLKRAGKIAVRQGGSIAVAAQALGALMATKQPGEAATPEEFWRAVEENASAMSEEERDAVSAIRDRIGQYIRGLGNKLDTATGHVLVDADDRKRRRALNKIKTAVEQGLAGGETAREVAQNIRRATGDLKREWLRVAQTELHNAVEETKAVALVGTHQGDPLVYKRPRPDACPFCVLLYLKPDKVTPRVFHLSELVANGTNVGRSANRPSLTGARATEWKPVLGAMHPFCGCELHHLPDGMGFNSKGELVHVGGKVKKAIEIETLNKAFVNHVCEE